MKIPVPPLVKWLLFAAACGNIFGQGVTYPNLTVSPYPPGFFGVGIPPEATSSNVFGVASQNGNFIAAVGAVVKFDITTVVTVPALFLPGGGITLLPTWGDPGVGNTGNALAISADGKIKVGTAVGGPAGSAAYWDMNNQLHGLPKGAADDATGSALAVSDDGSKIAGYVGFSDGNGSRSEAVLWAPGATGFTRLGTLPGFQDSIAAAVSGDGFTVAGHATKVDLSVQPPVYQTRAFRWDTGGPMQALPTFGGNVDTYAYGLAESSSYTVGQSGTAAVAWSIIPSAGVIPLPGGGDSIAYAIRASPSASSGGSGRVVGSRTTFGEGQEAVMWKTLILADEGRIKDILASVYKKSIGRWRLTAAYALSADGYTIGGEGINPNGQTEGWIAVLPPILRPPTFHNNPPATADLGEPFSRFIHVRGGPVSNFTATGLPAGFQIGQDGRITGSWNDPVAVLPGKYSVTIKATNAEGTGTGTFILHLPPPSSLKQIIDGHGFLPFAKPPGETSFERSFGAGVSGSGLVAVGQDGSGNDARAYRLTASDGITWLPMLPGALRMYGTALAANADGNTIVGQAASAPDADGNSRSVAVVWQEPVARGETNSPAQAENVTAFGVTNIGLFPGGIVSFATGVSADGSVVAGYGDAAEEGVNYQIWQAFRWTAIGGRQGLGWLTDDKFSRANGISPDGSTIVGMVSDTIGPFADPTAVAFRWTQANGMVSLGRLPGGNSASARAVSADNGTIVGESLVNASDSHAFRWTTAGGMIDLGVLPGDNRSGANAVSADGAIIVGFSRAGFSSRAFIWDAVNGMRDLKQVLVAGNPNLSNWTLRIAKSISADGKIIAGEGVNPNGIPEGFTAHLNSVISIESFSPPSGVPGTSVTIFGTRMVDAGSVSFNGASAGFVAETDEQITATVPPNATTGPISIMNPSDTANSAASFVVLVDTDGDGMSDAFEQQYFGSPTGGIAGDDEDGDGLTNLQEYKAGTSPTDPKSRFRIIEVRRQGSDIVVVFQAVANRRYRLEAGTSLQSGYPMEIETFNPSPSDVLHEVTNFGAAASAPRYYRVVLLP